jgi:hypothetical protein
MKNYIISMLLEEKNVFHPYGWKTWLIGNKVFTLKKTGGLIEDLVPELFNSIKALMGLRQLYKDRLLLVKKICQIVPTAAQQESYTGSGAGISSF